MNEDIPRPQAVVIVAIATIGCLAVAYLLWGFVSFSRLSLHDGLGNVALPMFTDKLIQHRFLFWALPVGSLLAGVVMTATGKHSAANLLIYISALLFVAIAALTFTVMALAIPWMPLIGNKVGS